MNDREWRAMEVLEDKVMDRPLDALVGASDSRIIDRPDWHQVVTPSFTSGGLNGVSRCRVGVERLDVAIDSAVNEYTQLGVRWRWTVGPHGTPGLAPALRRRGLAEHSIIGLCGQPNFRLGHRGRSSQRRWRARATWRPSRP